jgi:hypothetical protein
LDEALRLDVSKFGPPACDSQYKQVRGTFVDWLELLERPSHEIRKDKGILEKVRAKILEVKPVLNEIAQCTSVVVEA